MKIDEFASALYAFISSLNGYEYSLSYRDRIWNILFPDKNKHWQHLQIQQYERTYYVSHINGDSCTLEVIPNENFTPSQQFCLNTSESGFYNPAEVVGGIQLLMMLTNGWKKSEKIGYAQTGCYWKIILLHTGKGLRQIVLSGSLFQISIIPT